MSRRAALLVDGDNLSSTYQSELLKIGRQYGQLDIARVYMNALRCSAWHDAAAFRLLHSGTGKNATDILLTIDAVELAMQQNIEVMVIASSDGDFSHLHCRLREHGLTTVGIGEVKTPQALRVNCSEFVELHPEQSAKPTYVALKAPSKLDQNIHSVISANSKNGQGIPIADLNVRMRHQHDIKISTYPEKTWRGYLAARKDLYDVDPKGPDAHVRFKPKGFQG